MLKGPGNGTGWLSSVDPDAGTVYVEFVGWYTPKVLLTGRDPTAFSSPGYQQPLPVANSVVCPSPTVLPSRSRVSVRPHLALHLRSGRSKVPGDGVTLLSPFDRVGPSLWVWAPSSKHP